MGWFSGDHGFAKAFEDVDNAQHKASLTHELLAGAAAYKAAQEYEKYQEKHGKPDSHAKAKEILAGLTGAFIDRMVETKGLDYIDKQKAKREAEKHAHEALANSGDFN